MNTGAQRCCCQKENCRKAKQIDFVHIHVWNCSQERPLPVLRTNTLPSQNFLLQNRNLVIAKRRTPLGRVHSRPFRSGLWGPESTRVDSQNKIHNDSISSQTPKAKVVATDLLLLAFSPFFLFSVCGEQSLAKINKTQVTREFPKTLRLLKITCMLTVKHENLPDLFARQRNFSNNSECKISSTSSKTHVSLQPFHKTHKWLQWTMCKKCILQRTQDINSFSRKQRTPLLSTIGLLANETCALFGFFCWRCFVLFCGGGGWGGVQKLRVKVCAILSTSRN